MVNVQRSAKKGANLAKQDQAEQVSKSRNKLLTTMYKPFGRSLYDMINVMLQRNHPHVMK